MCLILFDKPYAYAENDLYVNELGMGKSLVHFSDRDDQHILSFCGAVEAPYGGTRFNKVASALEYIREQGCSEESGWDGCSVRWAYDESGKMKTVSLGIVQRPGLASAGYLVPMGFFLVCCTLLAVVYNFYSILFFAFLAFSSTVLVLAYSEFYGDFHVLMALCSILSGAATHVMIMAAAGHEFTLGSWYAVGLSMVCALTAAFGGMTFASGETAQVTFMFCFLFYSR